MTFSSAVMCGKRLKRWKTIPISARWRAMFRSESSTSLPFALPVADQVAVHLDPARVDLLQVVDAAEKRRLARARGPDEADDLAARDLEVDALQHLEPAEALVDVDRADDGVASPRRPARPGLTGVHAASSRSRSVSSSPRSLTESLRSIRAWIIAPDRRQDEVPDRDRAEELDRLERRRVVDLGVGEHLVDTDLKTSDVVLQHLVELVSERRHDHARRLWQDDAAHRQPVASCRATAPPPSGPLSIASMPARMISRMYAPSLIPSARMPANTAPSS